MEALDKSDSYRDERFVAQLIRAVVDVLGASMRAEQLTYVRMTSGQHLVLDRSAKLELGCSVAVFLDGDLILVGRIDRRPVRRRRLAIRGPDLNGKLGLTHIGLKGKTEVVRVIGVFEPVLFADTQPG